MNTELPPMPQSKAMSQSEIERLLTVAANNPASPDAGPASGEAGADPGPFPRHEFPQIAAFSAIEQRTLRTRHDEFIRALGGRLSGHLRTECGVQLTKMDTVRFEPFMAGLPNPTHLSLLRLDPPGGMCLLEIPPRLGLSMIDRELGGPGIFPDEPRELTKMEIKLLARMIDIFTSEWCSAWRDAIDLKPVLVRSETCPQFVTAPEPGLRLVVLGLEIRIGDVVEHMQMAFPHAVIEALLLKLNADTQSGEKSSKPKPAAPAQWNPGLNNIEMRVSAEWFGMEMTARQLGELKPGDVLPVSAGTAARVQVLVDSAPKFLGDLGKCGQQWAVKISGKHGG